MITIFEAAMKYDKVGMSVAEAYAKLSTCCRKQVGASILDTEGHTIATGYNGTLPGMKHCKDVFTDMNYIKFKEDHLAFAKKYEVHAEINAIITAGKLNANLKDAILYTTLSPCADCSKAIAAAGIKRVVYKEKYDREQICFEFLPECGVKIEQIEET